MRYLFLGLVYFFVVSFFNASFLTVIFFTPEAQARSEFVDHEAVEKFVTLENGHKLFTSYTAPQTGFPTLIFVNGLTYSTSDYTYLAERLKYMGYGIFLYDAFGMGETLLANPIPKVAIDYRDQIKELDELLQKEKIPAPYDLVGLSYGGGILIGYSVQYPQKVNKLFLLSPFTEVIESSKNIILQQIAWTKIFFPFNDATDEELADFYTRMFAYMNYPIFEPSVLENPYKLEGVILLTQGISPYRPIDEAHKIPKNKMHLMIGIFDQYVTYDVYEKFWQAAQPAEPCSFVTVGYSEHKLPESFPGFVARWINANYKDNYCDGETYVANPFLDFFLPSSGFGFYLPDYEED